MAFITIAAYNLANWHRDGDVQLRVYPLSSFIAADGTIMVQGKPCEDEAESGNFYGYVVCTLSGSVLTIPTLTIPSTTDSQDNPGARYGAFFFTNEGEYIGPFGEFASFALPASPTSVGWPAIEQAQGQYL